MRFLFHILTAVTLCVFLPGAGAMGLPGAGDTAHQPLLHRPALPVFSSPLAVRMPEADSAPAPLLLPERARVVFAGDVMQHMPQVSAARLPDGRFDYGTCFGDVAPKFAGADLAVVNLETTLTTGSGFSGYPCFRSPAVLADALRDAGVDVCVLANNHCLDGGAAGVRTTLAELDRCGIVQTGVFADSAGYRANHPLRLRAGNLRIALLNNTYGTNGIPVPKGIIVNLIDTLAMARDLRTAREDAPDCVVVVMHWGNEYERKANGDQRRLAEFLRRHGADVVIGSHPHVVQPFEADDRGVVFYSLGNFVSNQRGRYTDGGAMADVRITRRTDGRVCFDADAVPVWVLLPGYRILPPEAADTMRMTQMNRMLYDRFLADTQELLYQ